MVDFHNHILPGIDDGSSSRQESIDMLNMQVSQNVDTVIATPHFYANEVSVSHFLERRQKAFERLMNTTKERGISIPELRLGAEVYYFQGIGKAEQVNELAIQDSQLLLLEMPFCQWEKPMLEDVKALIKDKKLTLIMAHVERYYPFQKNKEIWEEIFDLPVHPQINAGSFLKWSRRRFCFKFMDEGHDILLGSDCHNTESRRPNIKEARDIIAKKKGSDVLAKIDSLGERLLKDGK